MIEIIGGKNERRTNRIPEPRYQESLSGADSVAARPETIASHVSQEHILVERPTVELLPLQKEPEKLPEKIRVSVIINAYNEEAEIGRLLDSLGKSWFPGVEVIISDDGSTDRTVDIVRKYVEDVAEEKPRGWLVLDSHENLGFVGAKNSGAAHARGEYLFFLMQMHQYQMAFYKKICGRCRIGAWILLRIISNPNINYRVARLLL